MIYETKLEACHAWVMQLNAIPQSMAFRGDDFDEWEFFGCLDEETAEEYGEEYGLVDVPMCGWVWMPSHSTDERWINNNRELVADLGFTICENYENGWLCLGIDGAGYDFYEAHWLPLYEARGLHWHKEVA